MANAGSPSPPGDDHFVPAGRTGAMVVAAIVAVALLVGAVNHAAFDGSRTPDRIVDQRAAEAVGQGDASPIDFGDEPDGPWQDLRGRWEHVDDAARLLSTPMAEIAVTVIQAPADARIGVTLDPLRNTAGLAFRVRDADNFWAVAPSAIARSWVLLRVEDGAVHAVAASPALFGPAARVEVRLRGTTIDVWLNGHYLMGALDGHLQRQGRAGMAGRGPGMRAARWRDFTVATDV